jgi:hypothetical protein
MLVCQPANLVNLQTGDSVLMPIACSAGCCCCLLLPKSALEGVAITNTVLLRQDCYAC